MDTFIVMLKVTFMKVILVNRRIQNMKCGVIFPMQEEAETFLDALVNKSEASNIGYTVYQGQLGNNDICRVS